MQTKQNSSLSEVSAFALDSQEAVEVFSQAFQSLIESTNKNYNNQERQILTQAQSKVTAISSLGELLGISNNRPPQDNGHDIYKYEMKLKLLGDVWLAIRQQLVKESCIINNEIGQKPNQLKSPNFGLIVPKKLAGTYNHPYDLTPEKLLTMQFSTETD